MGSMRSMGGERAEGRDTREVLFRGRGRGWRDGRGRSSRWRGRRGGGRGWRGGGMCVGRSGFEVDDFANVDRNVARHGGTGFFFAKERTLAGGDCFYSGSAVASSAVGVHLTTNTQKRWRSTGEEGCWSNHRLQCWINLDHQVGCWKSDSVTRELDE